MIRPLTTDLRRTEDRPYFLWDDDVSVAEFRSRLGSPDRDVAARSFARLLRDARYEDVWIFVTPQDVSERLPEIEPYLGRSRGLWTHLMRAWRELGLVR
jgi:hypothetical protein